MGCPTQCILGENLTFAVQAHTNSGAPVDATGNVAYKVYEDETATEILSGTMTKLASQTGFYSEQIACTSANGFERYKTYTIRITGTISGISCAKTYSFICLGVEDTVTATAGALTSRANFKSYIGLATTDDDALIDYLIARATSAIENYCERTLRSATYRELYDGNGNNILLLNEYPITEVIYLSKRIVEPLRITNTSTDAYNARVKITSTTMTLSIDGGTNDGSADALTLADYTLSTLATRITALGKNWSATLALTQFQYWKASELLPLSGFNCLSQYVYVRCPDEPEDEYKIYENEGFLYSSTDFPSGSNNIAVKYTAGYTTTPADLEQICIDLTNIYYKNRKHSLSVKSEKLGDHSITLFDDVRSIPESIAKRLAPYRKITV